MFGAEPELKAPEACEEAGVPSPQSQPLLRLTPYRPHVEVDGTANPQRLRDSLKKVETGPQ